MKQYLFIILILLSLPVYSQTYMDRSDCYLFSIPAKQDTIQFIKVGKDLNTPKPILLLCQGSLPVPMIMDYGDRGCMYTLLFHFYLDEIAKDYSIVQISMPHTPVTASVDSLNDQCAYVTNIKDSHSFSRDYLRNNYMEKYVQRATSVISYIRKQKWGRRQKIVIAGFSQGAKVAVKIAVANGKYISALGFFGGNPLGRIDQSIREVRLSAQLGRITEQEAQNRITDIYKEWQYDIDNIEKPSVDGEDAPRTTVSFSEPILKDLLDLKQPVYVAYGTHDAVSSYCDLLPIDFIRARKKNYKVVPCIGLDHSFYEEDKNGKPLVDHMAEVLNDFLFWLAGNK